ncbi:hypothetical protein WJX73_004385 [Symbiochloris irregularis]|uniref:BAP29/BAP31 transmembrane domain-containing protein n=1 Tax=Symbiochloris irregularis TaxID=706552 RepID=A0AAW1PUQ4_9CHLO
MSAWKIIINVFLPPPLILTILLLTPAPRNLHRSVLTFVDYSLGIRFVGLLSVLHFALLVTGAAFLNTMRETYFLDTKDRRADDVSPNVAFSQLGKKWRAERNFWISFLCFFLWLLLWRLYGLLKTHAKLEDQIVPGGRPSPATRPTSSPKKVT